MLARSKSGAALLFGSRLIESRFLRTVVGKTFLRIVCEVRTMNLRRLDKQDRGMGERTWRD